MTPLLTVDPDDPTPPYELLRRQFVILIHAGTLPADSRLPPLRQLAGDLGLAVGTVARTYRELEAAGLVRSRRGGGTRVAWTAPKLPTDERRRLLATELAAFLARARLLGFTRADVRDALDRFD